MAQWVKWLPFAQVLIPGSWDGARHWIPCSVESLLLTLPAHAHSLLHIIFLNAFLNEIFPAIKLALFFKDKNSAECIKR